MFKRARTYKIEKWIKKGRGFGVGSEYKPWLNIQDVASNVKALKNKDIILKLMTELMQGFD